ncbi:MAG: D-isomer specific 2-hydroxyacid dehydrogenase family protein [Emergencia sp.]
MKLFVYSMREFDEKPFFDQFCEKYGVEYGYTAETPCLENIHLAEGYDAIDIITTVISAEMLDRFAEIGIRCIATRTIGYDHIDVAHARELGICVTNVTYSPDSVADYTVMMMLMGLRRIKHIMMRGDVQDFTLHGKLGRELHNCTVGIVGTGRIGTRVLEQLSGFGCRLLCYDPYPNKRAAELAEYVSLETLMGESHIISLHAPATEENYHMIDSRAIAGMQDSVGIVNCARGALIDSDALIEAIESGKIGFACLDVVEHESGLYYFNRMGEPLNNPRLAILRSYSNVIVTSHMAFYTDEAVANMAENSILGVLHFFRGEENPMEVK